MLNILLEVCCTGLRDSGSRMIGRLADESYIQLESLLSPRCVSLITSPLHQVCINLSTDYYVHVHKELRKSSHQVVVRVSLPA